MKILTSHSSPSSSDILYLKASSNYTSIHYRNGRVEIAAYSLHFVAKKLAEKITFIRPNRKYIVNVSHVKNYDGITVGVANLRIPISRRRQEKVNVILQNQQSFRPQITTGPTLEFALSD